MISDVMFEAVDAIRKALDQASSDTKHYLREPVFANVYQGKLRTRIEKLVVEMDDIRRILDTPPE